LKARALFANKDSGLFPQQFVNTRLLVNTLHGATLIPTAAVQHNGQAAFVYTLQNNKAHLSAITVGVTDGQTCEVQGINPGDVLATSSFDKLQDNTPVTISKGSAAGAAGSGSGAPGGQGSHVKNNSGGKAPSGSTAP
jgi:multidrug efflux system membrane fusion protein